MPSRAERRSRAGRSALEEFRRRRSRRLRIRIRTGLAGALLSAAGVEVVRLGAPAPGAALAGAGAVLLFLLSFTGFGGADVGRWRRGSEGEAATGALLTTLSERRWAVWHDIQVPGRRANIDHVVIGRSGVWVIDSKTTRAVVTARWGAVSLGSQKLDTSPVRWEADVVRDLIGSAAVEGGRAVQVRPIVAVHGPGLRRRGGRAGRVRVVPATELVRRIRRGRRRLTRSEIRTVAMALSGAVGPPERGRVGSLPVGSLPVGSRWEAVDA